MDPGSCALPGLGSQMDHDLRLRPEHQNLEGLEVGKIADLVMPTMTGGPGRNQLTEEIRKILVQERRSTLGRRAPATRAAANCP